MITLVTGPPAAGKTTYVREHAGPDDVVIDYDALAVALSGPRDDATEHDHAAAVKRVTKTARQAAIDTAVTLDGVHVWIIHSSPGASLLAHYRNLGAEIITIDPGQDIVMRRIHHDRPAAMKGAAAEWYGGGRKGRDRAKGRKERGLGWRHQQQRERLMKLHDDGTPCWWCGKPMYTDSARNPDHMPLEADHTVARSKGGSLADRLLHAKCNRSRGDGARDGKRPNAPKGAPESLPWLNW